MRDSAETISEMARAALEAHQSGKTEIHSWMPEWVSDWLLPAEQTFPLYVHTELVNPEKRNSLRLCLIDKGQKLSIVASTQSGSGREVSVGVAEFDIQNLVQASRRMTNMIEKIADLHVGDGVFEDEHDPGLPNTVMFSTALSPMDGRQTEWPRCSAVGLAGLGRSIKSKEIEMNMIPVTLENTIKRMKREIIADVLAGYVPVNCASFAGLHAHRDANVYGGFCDEKLLDSMIKWFGGRDKDQGLPDGFVDYLNQAQQGANTWLQNGGLAMDCPPPGWEFCVGDSSFNPWGYLPYLEIYDKNIGGGGHPVCGLTVLLEGSAYCAAHGSVVMPERFVTAKEAADHAMTWAVENGYSKEDMKDKSAGGLSPIPAFSPCSSHSEHAKDVVHALVLRDAPNLVEGGTWSGKVLDVEHDVVIQKISREGNTVQHDATKLSVAVKVGDVVDIQYRDGQGVVTGKGKAAALGR